MSRIRHVFLETFNILGSFHVHSQIVVHWILMITSQNRWIIFISLKEDLLCYGFFVELVIQLQNIVHQKSSICIFLIVLVEKEPAGVINARSGMKKVSRSEI